MSTTHEETPAPVVGEGELYGYLAEYDTPGELIEAARKVRDEGYTDFDCYSPFPVHGIDPAMGIKRTILPLIIFAGGFTGAASGILLQWYCNAYQWGWNISGKPTWSIPANIPIAYELTILFSVFASFFGMWALNKLPQVWHPLFRLDRFMKATDDGFFIGIEARDRRFDADKTRALLNDAGAIAIEPCYYDPNPMSRAMPKWITAFIVASTAFALIPFAIAAKARNSHSSEPHFHIFPDMDFQPKFKSDTAMDMFPDGRANRGDIPGTIARGWLEADDTFWRGLDNGQWTTGFPKANADGQPFVVDQKLLARGQNRFNIYCTPCHGMTGDGLGIVVQRGYRRPPSLHIDRLREAPIGYFFDVMTHGFGAMPDYAAQITPADRWAIAAYIRALQLSGHAKLTDFPEAKERLAQ